MPKRTSNYEGQQNNAMTRNGEGRREELLWQKDRFHFGYITSVGRLFMATATMVCLPCLRDATSVYFLRPS